MKSGATVRTRCQVKEEELATKQRRGQESGEQGPHKGLSQLGQ